MCAVIDLGILLGRAVMRDTTFGNAGSHLAMMTTQARLDPSEPSAPSGADGRRRPAIDGRYAAEADVSTHEAVARVPA